MAVEAATIQRRDWYHMSEQDKSEKNWHRSELLSLLSTSGALAGLSITVVALMNTINKAQASVSIVDNIFGICAAIFLLCTYLIFWALRTHSESRAARLTKLLEGLFLFALSGMIIATFLMLYTLW
jgi:heme/copper-type cytochrome/quinol oxidase subunit 2